MLGILFQCKCAYEMFLKGGVELECYVVLAQPLLCCRLHWYEAGAAAAAVVKPSDWDNQIWALIGPSTEERAGTSEGEKRRWTWLKRTSVDLSTGDRGCGPTAMATTGGPWRTTQGPICKGGKLTNSTVNGSTSDEPCGGSDLRRESWGTRRQEEQRGLDKKGQRI